MVEVKVRLHLYSAQLPSAASAALPSQAEPASSLDCCPSPRSRTLVYSDAAVHLAIVCRLRRDTAATLQYGGVYYCRQNGVCQSIWGGGIDGYAASATPSYMFTVPIALWPLNQPTSVYQGRRLGCLQGGSKK